MNFIFDNEKQHTLNMVDVMSNSFVSVIIINNADEKYTRDKKFVFVELKGKMDYNFHMINKHDELN